MTAALLIAHPGHELRILGSLRRRPAHVAILTDGSGGSRSSRVERTLDLLGPLGCSFSSHRGRCSDRTLYRKIKDGDAEHFWSLACDVAAEWTRLGIEVVYSDLSEGYNPAHDLAQGLAHVARRLHERRHGPVSHWAFALTGRPGDVPESGARREEIELTQDEFEFKLAAARRYEELAEEVAALERDAGLGAFRKEVFLAVEGDILGERYLDEAPYYESYGRQQVERGIYQEVLTYQDHFRPLMESLLGRLSA